MTKKEAFEVTRDFWKWASKQNRIVEKRDWDRYYELREIEVECAFCENFAQPHRGRCDSCPLGKQLGFCYDTRSCFDRWLSDSVPQQKAAAREIYKFTDQYIKDNFKQEDI